MLSILGTILLLSIIDMIQLCLEIQPTFCIHNSAITGTTYSTLCRTRVWIQNNWLLKPLNNFVPVHIYCEWRLKLLLIWPVNHIFIWWSIKVILRRKELSRVFLRVKLFSCLQDKENTTSSHHIPCVWQEWDDNVFWVSKVGIFLAKFLHFISRLPEKFHHTVEVSSTRLNIWGEPNFDPYWYIIVWVY